MAFLSRFAEHSCTSGFSRPTRNGLLPFLLPYGELRLHVENRVEQSDLRQTVFCTAWLFTLDWRQLHPLLETSTFGNLDCLKYISFSLITLGYWSCFLRKERIEAISFCSSITEFQMEALMVLYKRCLKE